MGLALSHKGQGELHWIIKGYGQGISSFRIPNQAAEDPTMEPRNDNVES